jgi:hypothetical protein
MQDILEMYTLSIYQENAQIYILYCASSSY